MSNKKTQSNKNKKTNKKLQKYKISSYFIFLIDFMLFLFL